MNNYRVYRVNSTILSQSVPPCLLPSSRAGKKTSLWGQSYSDWTRVFYSPSFLHFWWNGACSISLLQETCFPPIIEEECSLWLGHVLDPLQDLLRPHPFSYSLSPRHSLSPYPSVTRLWSCTHRVPNCPGCLTVVFNFWIYCLHYCILLCLTEYETRS